VAELLDVMDGLEEALARIPGMRVSSEVPGQVTPPHAVVGVPPIQEYRVVFQLGVTRLEMPIYVFVSAAVDRVGQRLLAELASPTGPRSVRAAVEADRTLGGRVADVTVRDFRPLNLEEVGQIGYLGGLWNLSILINPRS